MRTYRRKSRTSRRPAATGAAGSARPRSGRARGANPLLRLQRTVGNRGVQRSLKAEPEGPAPDSAGVAHGSLRPMLKMNAPGDVHEREAERVADRVLRMPEPTHGDVCACGGKCQACRSGHEPPTHEKAPPQMQRSPEGRGALPAPAAPRIVDETVGSAGRPLDEGTRAFMEPRFGHDFGRVRVHTDAEADASARAVNALAYTVGRDIVFRAGAFRPGAAAGRRLLAHELAHVVQQTRLGAGPRVQRFEGPEHQDLGDRHLDELLAFLQTPEGAEWARELGLEPARLVARMVGERVANPLSRGVRIRLDPRVDPETGTVETPSRTPGEIIALMGDFYGSVEQLAGAPTEELEAILEVMREERAGAAPDAAQRFEEITGGRYLELAQRNDAHFARLNRAEWRRLHEEAIAEARAAGREGDEARFQRALLTDAAAGHFLTDAFAAGHLFDKSEVLAAITLHLMTDPAVTQNPQMQAYLGVVAAAGRLPQLVLKNIHDRMNREGFEVRNARGMEWRTFGDSHLEVSEETQRVAALAVFLSRRQIFAARAGESPDPDEVEALMPDEDSVERATRRAIGYIPDAVADVEGLIYRNRSVSPSQFGPVLGGIIESNLETIGHPGREREIEEALEAARRSGRPAPVVPSFTIFSW